MLFNYNKKLLCHSRVGGNPEKLKFLMLFRLDTCLRRYDTIGLMLFVLILCFPLGTNAEQMRGLRSMQLSECGQAIAGFKQFLREARHCQSSNDCVAVDGKCPLGCKFYVHKIFQTIIEKRREEVGRVCGNTQCSVECPEEEDIKLICKNKRCEKVK